MRNALGYATRVWLTAAVLAPTGLYLWDVIVKREGDTPGWLFALILVFGGVFSIPSWLALGVATWIIQKSALDDVIQKIILTIVSALLTLLPFFFFNFFNGKDFYLLAFCYWATVTAGLWFYPFNLHSAKPSAHPLDQLS